MKKETIITIRVSSEIKAIIQQLAEKDERTVGWMARKLITEALESRDLLKKPKKKDVS
ncbi:MAG: ribbon-helix-helix protein, CopG family [Thermodesulfovibrionales bacterium]|nr:ribbon-helix-helix protein, CopG family [Thermodesulfovibrionales bacterium]